MRLTMCGLAIAVTVGITPVGVGVGAESTPPKAPDGYIQIEEEVWRVVDDEPEEHSIELTKPFLRKI